MPLPDYRTVPTSRSQVEDLPKDNPKYQLWLLYGNDHDGPQGEFCPAGTVIDGRRVGVDVPLSQDQFVWWYTRNPGHNRDIIENRRPVISPNYAAGEPKNVPLIDGTDIPDWRYEVNNFYVSRTNPSFFKIGWFYFGYRSDKPGWPVPEHWLEHDPTLGPGGGAADRGFKKLSFP